MGKKDIIKVQPNILEVLDIKDVSYKQNMIEIAPYFYDCKILFSPNAISQLISYAIKKRIIQLDGKLTMIIDGRRKVSECQQIKRDY